MNCRRFQHRLYDYLDGTLSPGAQAAAERHRAECAACRQALSAERQVARSLSGALRRATDSLELPPEARRRVLAALAEQRRAPDENPGGVFCWRRLAWPLGLAAVWLLLLSRVFLFPEGYRPQPGALLPRVARNEVLIQLSFVAPTYTFRREGGSVIDVLTYQTNVVNARLPAEPAGLK